MFASHRNLLLAALVIGLAGASAHAQLNMPTLAHQQAPFNTAVLGGAYRQTVPFAGGPALAAPFGVSPYALSTTGGYNPYLGTGSIGASPYSLSTMGGYGSNGMPFYGPPVYGNQARQGAALQGYASMINATGQYYKNIQQASLTRQQVRQMSYETTRRRIELLRWFEATRLKPEQLRSQQMAAELERARNDAPEVDISSGRALNVLLRSIQKSSQLNLGPNIALDEDNLKHINLTSAGTAGNIGMLKDPSKISWPAALQATGYDAERKRLNRNLVGAVAFLKDGEPVPDSTLKDIRADYKTINDKFGRSIDDLDPGEYIKARRFLTQLNQAVRALGDENVGKFFTKNWIPKGKNVAELVSHLSKEGLTFAPATPGDHAAYNALYLAMRQFDLGLAMAQAAK